MRPWCLVVACLLVLGLESGAEGSFTEEFGEGWAERWDHSSDEKYAGRFTVEDVEVLEDPALKIPKDAQHYGLAALLKEPVKMSKGITVQYEAKWSSKHTCGGGYLKFFTYDKGFKAADMQADTPYSIMFGPDKCGATNKVHLILRHKSPIDGEYEEKHLEETPSVPSGKLTHVYTATIRADNTVEVMVDGEVEKKGTLFDLFTPPINPPEEIPDPSDIKPEDWVDDEQIPDPEAKKPDDWVDEPLMVDEDAEKPSGWLDDEPEEVDDPDASMPDDWDTEEDGDWLPPKVKNPKCEAAPGCGEWQRPMVPNPDYTGEWEPPMIPNPAYKGPWVQRKIPNPKYFKDDEPLLNIGDIGALGFEIWTMDSDIYFDNIVVTNDPAVAEAYRRKWKERNALEKAAEEEKKKSQESKQSIGDMLENLLMNPSLEPVRPYLIPIVEYAKQNELVFIAALSIGAIALLSTFLAVCCQCCCRRKSKKDTATRKAKKEDVTGPDDKPDVSESKVEEEDGDADNDDDDEDKGEITPDNGGSRRRRRRAE